jgi:magnesium and cobalt transporter
VRGLDLAIAFLGLYLAVAVGVSAWQRRAASAGRLPVWVCIWGAWVLAAGARWSPARGIHAFAFALLWLLGTLALVQAGAALASRASPRAWLWLLGPGHALAMVGAWLAELRARRSRVSEPPATGAGVLESVLELGETPVSEVMVPRGEIEALPEGSRVRDWAQRVEASRHGNLPVYRNDLDEILGYVALEDLFRAGDPEAPVTGFLREARFVPETMRGDDLLRELLAHGERIAIAVDEFGGTAGLVRERDLCEILVGEVDRAGSDAGVRRVAPGVVLVEGTCRVEAFNRVFPDALPEGEYETVAGLVLHQAGRIPAAGESLAAGGARLEVVAADSRRVLQLRVTLPPSATRGEAARGDR